MNATGTAQELMRETIKLNRVVSARFIKNKGARMLYRLKHPTEIAVFECMDGRVNLAKKCGMPLGLYTAFENIGGKFSLTWPLLANDLLSLVRFASAKHTSVCAIITHHWSNSDNHLGCAGFGYNTAAACQSMDELFDQMMDNFFPYIVPVRIGIETDSWTLTLLGNGSITTDKLEPTNECVRGVIADIWPWVTKPIAHDLAPYIKRNIGKIHASAHRAIPLKHNERIICISPNADWLIRNTHNMCLAVSIYDPDVEEAIGKSAEIILNNYMQGQVPHGGVALSCFPYRSVEEINIAAHLARHYAELAKTKIEGGNTRNFFKYAAGIVDMNTRRLIFLK